MKNKLTPFLLLSVFLLPSCSKREATKFSGETLIIYNVEDYISNGEDGCADLIADFEAMYPGVEVKYYTYDTNETMYNQFKLQKEGTYDLVLGSEYIIQKMVKEDLLQPFDDFATYIPNYENNASSILRNKLKNMEVTLNDETVNLDQYAVGYMWGTLGLIYDPEFISEDGDGYVSWDDLVNKDYEDKISLKNSMRDAYDAGLLYSYSKEEEYINLLDAYYTNPSEFTYQAFNTYIQSVFDFKLDGSEESSQENLQKIERVKEALITIKDNIFGFETDSGKNDIVEGSKIKMDLAYSGDAVYSIETALEDADKVLKYQVPKEGGNIWYDAWMLPKGANKDLAYAFLDFLCDSSNAASNTEYIGYTPFIIGDEMFTTIAGWYGASEYDASQVYYEENYVIGNDNKLYTVIVEETDGQDISDDTVFECLEYDNENEYEDGDMVSKDGLIYNIVYSDESNYELEQVEAYDISHIYGDSLTNRNAIIYPFAGSENILETQYPSEEIIYRCAVMNDYGVYNDNVIIMWGQVKAYTDMTPVYIILLVTLVIVVALVTYTFIAKRASARFKRNKGK